jgi:hypothetical protein
MKPSIMPVQNNIENFSLYLIFMFLERRWEDSELIFPRISKDLLTDTVISSQVLVIRHSFIEKDFYIVLNLGI